MKPQAHHRDTPPEDDYVAGAGLLARGSRLRSGLPGIAPSDTDGPQLAAYSCGGSAGIARIHGRRPIDQSAPASLLAPGLNVPENLDH